MRIPPLTTPRRDRHTARRPLRGAIARVRPDSWIADAPETPAVQSRDRVFRRLLALADALAAALALLMAVDLLGEDTLKPVAVVFVPFVLVFSKVIGLYDRDELLLHKTTLDDAPQLLQVATAYTLIAWVAGPLIIEGGLGRDQAVGLWAMLLIGSLLGRAGARAIARRRTGDERCLLVSDAASGDRMMHQLAGDHGTAAKIVGRVALDQGHDLAHSLDRVKRAVADKQIDRVIVAPRTVDSDGVLDAIRLSKGLGVKVSLLPRVFEVVGSSVEFDDIAGMPVLGLRRFGLTRSSWVLKTIMDRTGALVLLTLASPVMLAAALAIKLESRGPILFRQTRVGRDGKRFQIRKFRTMVVNADAMKAQLRGLNETEGLFKIADDPRITRVGRLLRRTSLDELPQLINVLRGEMSLVGPRPLVVDEDDQVEGWHRRRLHLTPGMTGQWQILGSARIPLHEMVKIDYLYVANWSLWGDVKILIRTLPYLLRGGGM
jgi:exopolysaccharide biosynthesis polyprenyl glycosylphosphotransferase